MIEIKGKYTTATIMVDEVEPTCLSQIVEMVNNPIFTNPIVIMPDTHAGKGSVIGFTMSLGEKLLSSIVGVDIGCGMLSFKVNKLIDLPNLDQLIRKRIPMGHDGHSDPLFKSGDFNELARRVGCKNALESLGTLGGGNHFIEVGEMNGEYWITIHSGSRNLGLKTALYWDGVLEGERLTGYLADMRLAQYYASLNRHIMSNIILSILGTTSTEFIETIHNYIGDDNIIRKGAISSYCGEKSLIPLNPKDGILVCEGVSDPSWNFSAPHGAGRVLSRSAAKASITKEMAEEAMSGVYTSSFPRDESPLAYKKSSFIKEHLNEKVLGIIKPIMNIKG